MILFIWSYCEFPGKIGNPKYNSLQIQPSDHKSIPKEYFPPKITSGAL